MKIICDRQLFNNAIIGVSKAVSVKTSMPILESILIKAYNNIVTFIGYDLEIGITTNIEALVLEEGEVVISSKLLCEIIRKLDSDEITINCDENMHITITGGITNFNLISLEPEEFTEMPKIISEHSFTIDANTLKNMISSTIFAVSQNDSKPALTGLFFEMENSKLTLVGLDGFRLAITSKNISNINDIKIIIPQKTMQELSNLITEETETIEINANRKFIIFKLNNYTITSRLIEGEYLNYKKVIPTAYTTKVTVNTKEFIRSLERTAIVINDRLKQPVKISFLDNIFVECNTTLGKIHDEIDADIQGNEIEIGFNNKFLLDALKNANTEEVILEISGTLQPMKILPLENDEFLYLVLPVRIK